MLTPDTDFRFVHVNVGSWGPLLRSLPHLASQSMLMFQEHRACNDRLNSIRARLQKAGWRHELFPALPSSSKATIDTGSCGMGFAYKANLDVADACELLRGRLATMRIRFRVIGWVNFYVVYGLQAKTRNMKAIFAFAIT